jgi:hypothetical protein
MTYTIPLPVPVLLCDFKIRACSFWAPASICANVTYASWSAPKEEPFQKIYEFQPLEVTSSWLAETAKAELAPDQLLPITPFARLNVSSMDVPGKALEGVDVGVREGVLVDVLGGVKV